MTKVPNILDHLDAMLGNATGVFDQFTLATARDMCAEFIRTRHDPPSWPLNLDEWELWEGHTMPEGSGWWLLHTAEKLRCVRRRKARAEQVTLSGEDNR